MILIVLISGASLGGCEEPGALYFERSVEDLYNTAMDQLLDGNYELAAGSFEEVERQHPYSVWATKAQLMSAYAHYQGDSYDEAVISANRFISLHPGNPDAAYAHYLKGISYYEQISDVGRDQKMTRLSLEAFEEIVRRYPTSRYARDAQLKMDLARDHLAGKEMEIGRTYQSLDFYLAAINRFRNVVERFQTTSHVPEALHRLTETYLALGVIEEAQATAAVLGHNFPGSRWYSDSYALLEERELEPRLSERSWLLGIF
ncbi:MAG: outer membrane protein assembly factor BamD [Alphaproteobacteria bacterium]|jgi:outer membrane protein assembly factor BamD|nr:outer membrane protein assembly factor BamD [Alphaproteobacteria bacterium]MDP6516893.1 outer membrane protein assembly factor BamD [Alphaproteobacteria bacterium]|tara:strand:+ start:36 stop:815 length:780 start_codon:yes stop_codon:yes gene_type:complete